MRPTRLQLASFALVGLAFGLASAAPTAKKKLPFSGVAASCTEGPPTPARCVSFDTIPEVKHRDPEKRRPEYKRAYLESPCGKKYRENCRAHVEHEFEDQHEKLKAPVVKMLTAKGTNIPDDVNEKGKLIDYPGPTKTKLLGTFTKIGKTTVPSPSLSSTTVKSRNLSTTSSSPADVKRVTAMGSTRPKHKLAKVAKMGTKQQTSDNILARTGLTRPPHSGSSLPTNAHRNPAWDANGEKVLSCEEYAYEQTYDWARFTDAMAACAGDQNCQLDVAFLPSTPGIANRTLKAKDGTPTKTQVKPDTIVGKMPKNDLFSYGNKFAYSGGPNGLPPSADIDKLADALEKGAAFYKIGCSGACKSGEFADEWAFHKTMHDRHRTVSKAEFEELERRKARFRELISQHRAAVQAEGEAMKKKLLGHKLMQPLDLITPDPFERLGLMQTYARETLGMARQVQRSLGAARVRGMAGAGLRSVPVNQAPQQQTTGALDLDVDLDELDFRGGTMPAAGVLAAPAPRPGPRAPTTRTAPRAPTTRTAPRAPTTRTAPRAPTPSSPGASRGPLSAGSTGAKAIKKNPCNPKDFPGSDLSESLSKGPISCQIGEFLREEWNRMKSGQVSCLDLNGSMCDWSPMMFEARFVEGLPYIKEQNEHEAYCLDWTNDNMEGGKPSLTAAAEHIEDKRKKIEEQLKLLAPHKKEQTKSKQGLGFGSGFTDADHFGDKALFAAGYDYDLGWDVEPQKVGNTGVCELGGGARAGFGVDGWFINNQFSVIHALLEADYNRPGTKNEKKQEKPGYITAELHLFEGVIKFLDEHEEFSGAWSQPLFREEIQIPTGYKPSFSTMAGPVPITGAVWGEFFVGADLKLTAVTEAGPNCDMNKLKFGVNAGFVPVAGLNAKAQVGVGISGLLSAGIRGMINLVTVGVPVEVGLSTKIENMETSLGFDLDVKLALSTLSGYISVYVELLIFEEEFVLFRWNGLGPTDISLLGQPLEAELPLFVMK